MTSLRTSYLGLDLRSPVVASAGPLSQNPEGVVALADAGVGAVVLYSLFEEQIRFEQERDFLLEEIHNESYGEALTYFPTPVRHESRSDRYLDLVRRSVAAVDAPVIASLNGSTYGGWTDFAWAMQDAGAAAVELNIYLVPGTVTADARAIEDLHVSILESVKRVVTVPVAVKLSPYMTSLGQLAARLDDAGADGLVLFNRFIQPDINLEHGAFESGVELSSAFEARLPRTWIAALRGRVGCSLAGTTGVETAEDVVKYLLAGADVAMTTSALVRHGAAYAGELVAGVDAWLGRHGMTLDEARGRLAVPVDADAAAYNRQGYVSGLEKAKSVYGAGV